MEAARSERVSAGSRGTETETRRTAPARAAGAVRGVCRACSGFREEDGQGKVTLPARLHDREPEFPDMYRFG
jgi:hypothetical protein